MPMITDVEEFFEKGCGRCARFATPECSTRRWIQGLNGLRRVCRDAGLEEAVRWGHPCYRHGDRNVAIIGAFRSDFRLTFFEAGLMRDPEHVLEKQGPNAQVAGMLRFTDPGQVAAMAPVIAAYLEEAKGYAAAGITAPRLAAEVDLPDELVEALDADPEMAEAFHALTPGRRRSYAINLSGAKKRETRLARIEKFRGRILDGKGALER